MNRSSLFCLAVLAAGCSSAPSPFAGPDFETARSKPRLPYAVKINPVRFDVGGGAPVTGLLSPAIADEERERELRELVREALESYQVFSKVAYSEPALGVPPDLELNITVSGTRTSELGTIERPGFKPWVNAFLWLLAGFPSWFMDDVRVRQEVSIEYAVLPPGMVAEEDEGRRFSKRVDLDQVQSLNFTQRWGVLQFFLNWVIPTPWVPLNRENTEESLFENYVALIQRDIARGLKEEFPLAALEKGETQVLVLSPAPGGAPELFTVVLSHRLPESIAVERVGRDGPRRLVLETAGAGLRALSAEEERELEGWLREALGTEPAGFLARYPYRYGLRRSAGELGGLEPDGQSLLRVVVELERTGAESRPATRTVLF